MDPIYGGLANIAGGLIGSAVGGNANQQAQDLDKEQLQRWLALNVPDPEQQKLFLQQYELQGKLSPELEQAIKQGDSKLNDINVDPRLRQSEMDALSSLQNVSNSGGMTLGDRANLEKGLGEARNQYRGTTDRALQAMQERGMSGSGMELAARMQAGQGAGQMAANAGLDAAGAASNRALQALSQAGNLGSQLEQQQFGQQKDVASAQDLINPVQHSKLTRRSTKKHCR
jgi:hypothetical protein